MKKERYAIIIVFIIGLLWCNEEVCASNKVALVIGNGDYRKRPLTRLQNPVNDANDLSKVLISRLGFDVIKKTNVNHQKMEDALIEFGQKIEKIERDGIALFYFSGHGAQVDNINYLLPVGRRMLGKADIKYNSISVQYTLEKMKEAGSKVNIIILDACRDNPAKGLKGAGQGLAAMNDAEGAFISYATGAGKTADENLGGRNSLYTKNLLKIIQTPGVQIEELFRRVRYQVSMDSKKEQIPWTASGLDGKKPFYFIPPVSTNPPPDPDPEKPINPGTDEETKTKQKGIGKYTDNGDGTITDTGLMWKRCAEGLSGVNCEKGKVKKYTWNGAVQRFKNVEYAGYTDWRMPTIEELKTLVYCSKGVKDKKRGRCNDGSTKPTINQQAFPNTMLDMNDLFWSGSPNVDASDSAWYVNFIVGSSAASNRIFDFAVRLVRSGQSPKNSPQGNPDPGTAGKTRIGKYIDNGNGTITDTKTGLMWKRCAEGLSGENCEKGKAKDYTWDDAVKRFKNVSYANYSDWRMPTIDELKTLVYCSKGVQDKDSGRCNKGSERPTINQQAFPNTKYDRWSCYWSGSPYAGISASAWYVNFNYGYSYANYRSVYLAVRLVRGGQ